MLAHRIGTGEGLIARVIHYNGPRAAKPFGVVNCAALDKSDFVVARRGRDFPFDF